MARVRQFLAGALSPGRYGRTHTGNQVWMAAICREAINRCDGVLLRRILLRRIRSEDTDGYHLYVTNLPDEFNLKQVTAQYRLWREVDLLFQELKSMYE